MVKSHSRVRIPLTPYLFRTDVRFKEGSLLFLPRAGFLRFLLCVTLFAVAAPCLYLGGASLAFTMRQRAADAAYAELRLPPAVVPTRSTRLLVFAPHPDDEILGCGGLIQQTLAAGGHVEAVIFTNGDGFRTGVECAVHSLHVEPRDYLAYAEQRQCESRNALTLLGVPQRNISFLGYPDQGLRPMWFTAWTPDRLYTSGTTRCDHVPYSDSFDSNAAYCGQDVLADVKAAMQRFHPTLITVTHPAEDHIDHAAAAAFVACALHELQTDAGDAPWAARAHVAYYLIHRGDWPSPQGLEPGAPLAPPAAMARADTHWTTLTLTPRQVALKARSIDLYVSQTAMMGRFLHSFARRTEIYGDLATVTLPSAPDDALVPYSPSRLRSALLPVIKDPVQDNVLRDLNGGGDIRDLYACKDQHDLVVRLDCRTAITSRVDYRIWIRPFGLHGETGRRALMFDLRPSTAATAGSAVRTVVHDDALFAKIPWMQIAADCPDAPVRTLAVDVETSMPGVVVDRTGIRFLAVRP